ncbi:MAG: tRNA (adenosine(37)-N6)-threonylcarbamoyltransferase complex dimerization subunit type 1 TsaB [Eubacterium sp.]|nr:tRNA (adenosine(37)-N6)-threonylcarbamoyltransferase complex dimerization subunit type 1 TsaB [Eubacterium sp.]
MKILAIDSSSVAGSVALYEDGEIKAEYLTLDKRTHSETLLPLIDKLKSETGLDLSSLDAIAITGGPGSYTGLRIGGATAKGLGLALDKPIINIPTMEALAYNVVGSEVLVCPMMDARKNRVFTGLYKFDGEKIVTVKDQCVLTIDELVDEINEEVIFIGDGVDAYRDLLDEKMSVAHLFASEEDNYVKASSFVFLAKIYFDEGKITSAGKFAPDYLMLSQAERELKEKQKND